MALAWLLQSNACPPKYADIGKQVKDLFNKNFNFGNIKFDVKAKNSSCGSIFGLETQSEIATGKLSGFAEFKNEFRDKDLTIVSKWLSENVLNSEIYFENRFAPGTKFGLLGSFDPKGGKLNGGVQAEYKNEFLFAKIDAGCQDGNPSVIPSLVLNLNGILCGTQATVNPHTKKIENPNFMVGYQTDTFSTFANLTDKQELFGLLYQKVTYDMEAGISCQFPYGQNKDVTFEIAMAYNHGGDQRIQAKVNTKCQVGLALIKSVGGIQLSLCANVDGKNIKQGNHQLGLGIQMEA